MSEAIEGRVSTSFTKGNIGLRFTLAGTVDGADTPETPDKPPLAHVSDARFTADKAPIRGGRVVIVETGKNLVLQVGYRSPVKSYGFGVRITRGDSRIVDSLYFPSTGTPANTWLPGNIDSDDDGNRFLVLSKSDLKLSNMAVESNLTVFVWPITGWSVEGTSYGKTESAPGEQGPLLKPSTRSATLVGVVSGDKTPQALNMRYARIVAEDTEKLISLSVKLLEGKVTDIAKSATL